MSDGCALRGLPGRDGIVDAKIAQFTNVSRSTMMPVVIAVVDAGLVMFVFKGKNLSYRTVISGGATRAETIA